MALATAKSVLRVEPSLEAALDGVIAVSDQIDRRRVVNGAEAEDLQGLRADYHLGAAARGSPTDHARLPRPREP